MKQFEHRPARPRRLAGLVSGLSMLPLATAHAATYDLGNVFVTTSAYAGKAMTVTPGQKLPNTNGATATNDGTYPGVFANDAVDANFGITSPIQIVGGIALSSSDTGVSLLVPLSLTDLTALTGVTTSFSSKSELALNVSTDGSALTFIGYHAPANRIDVSNSNTPGVIDPTNTDTAPATPRSVVRIDLGGKVSVTDTDAYSGNNGRAAILVRGSSPSTDALVMTGNAGNGSGTEPALLVANTGVQTIAPGAAQPGTLAVGRVQGSPGASKGFQYGFSVTGLGYPADKSGKDDNFRGATVFGSNLFVSKGSGSNGVDTVYEVSLPGGLGAVAAGASGATVSVLPGLPTGLAANISATDPGTELFPFGIWFANATTLYVADEGVQGLQADPNAGLQKWLFDGTRWHLAYVIQAGLALDTPYSVPGYPQNLDPATSGLRNIAGHVDGNTATVFAATATASDLTDPGADPNRLVSVVDRLDATTLPGTEAFRTVIPAIAGRTVRGVAYVPCADFAACVANTRIGIGH